MFPAFIEGGQLPLSWTSVILNYVLMAEAPEKTVGLKIEEGEGARLRALKDAINHTVEKILGSWKPSLFVKCFPLLAKENEECLEAIRVSVVESVRRVIYEDINAIIEEDVAKSLEELGTLVKKYSGPLNRKSWRPSGDPVMDMRAHDAKVLQYEKMRLLKLVQSESKASEHLLKKVEAGRAECHKNHLEIKEHMSVLTKLNALALDLPQEKMMSHTEAVLSSDLPKLSMDE